LARTVSLPEAGRAGPQEPGEAVNAGAIPADHRTQDRAVGSGRLVGETWHFVDLLRFLVGTPLKLGTLRRLAAYGWPGFSKMHVWRQDKGQAVHTGGASPIAMEGLSEVGKAVAGVEKGLG
jgi:hypothetical protein